MTQNVQTENEWPNSFRAVVENVERHRIRVAHEYQGFEYATPRPDLRLRRGEVVLLARSGNQYKVQQVLPYQHVEYVRHPQVPGLRGTPLADIKHPGMFSVKGLTYVREGEPAHTEVKCWTFESANAEADYLGSVLMGGSELPGVQLSTAMLERLAGLGVDTGSLARVAEERRRVEGLQHLLKAEAQAVATRQEALRKDIAQLIKDRAKAEADWRDSSKKAQQADSDLQTLFAGIEDAEKEKERILDDNTRRRTEAENEREQLLAKAQEDAQSIRSAAAQDKAEAQKESESLRAEAKTAARLRQQAMTARDEALTAAQEIAGRTKAIQQVLEHHEDRGAARQELLGRKPYGAAEEIPALQAALLNLRPARGTTPEQLVALHVGLKHTPFTVLAGPSGSGKTSLVLAYAQQMGIHVTTVAVQPGWTSVQDLHGYVNPLRPGEYRSTPFFEALGYQVRQSQAARLRELLRGDAAAELPGQLGSIPLDLVLLDEINLSHVEYFLADYLSAFELDSRNVAVTTPDEALKLALGDEGQPDDTHPLAWLRHVCGQLDVPRSFLIAGTANEDDTTRGFSDKFRDRSAFLHVEAPTLETATLKRPKEVKDGKKYVPQQTWEAWLDSGVAAEMSRELIEFSERLRSAKLPVSVRLFQRTARMSGDARRLLEALEVPHAPRVALDLAVSLGIAHKYAQLTEGRSPEAQQKRKDLREALERLLAGRQQTTFSSLGWGLEA